MRSSPIHGDSCRGPTANPYLSKCGMRSILTIGFRTLTRNVITEDAGNTRGRKDRLRGQIGVRTNALNEGWTIGPPADKE